MTKEQRQNGTGKGLQSSVAKVMLINNDAQVSQVTELSHLFCYHWEDTVQLQVGNNLVLHLRYSKKWLKKVFNSKPIEVGEIQQQLGIDNNIVSIGGLQVYLFQARIFATTMHHKTVSGHMSKAKFVPEFGRNERFSAEFTQTNIRHTFTWRYILNLVDQLYFFGPPLNASSTCNPLFWSGWENAQYTRKIYCAIAHDTFGDTYKASCLSTMYRDQNHGYEVP